ncbi:unnamed protein product [Caenorhabditis sp. 36 PRJEB53466]|nr:unnamed protein product [Caenorhabditis sp. 36 PRJEB53466]
MFYLRLLALVALLVSSASAVTICSSSSILSTFTDPLCTSWCKIRLCSSGSCKSAQSGQDATCQCESCTFGNWFSSSSDSTSNQPVTGQYYTAGSGGIMPTQNGNNNGYNNGYDTGYNNNNGYNNGYRNPAAAGYGNSNSNFNTNQQYSRDNQYASNVPSGYGNGGQANYASGYQK